MGDIKRPFKKGRGSTEFLKKAAPVVLPFVLPGVGSAISGALGGGLLGSAGAGAAMSAITGGDPLKGAIGGAISGGILGNLPGDVGKFFDSDVGRAITGSFDASGRNPAALSGILEQFGLSGRSKDMVEELLTLGALAAFSNKFAKDALNKAKEFEDKERASVQNLVAQAEKLSDPVLLEQNTQKAMEQVSREFGKQREAVESNLFARGLGRRVAGPMARLGAEEAAERLRSRRDLETAYPERALRAQAATMAPLQNLSERLRATAEEERRLPFELYQMLKEETRPKSPMEQYYADQLAKMRAQEAAAAGGPPAGVAGGATFDVGPQGLPGATTGGGIGEAAAQQQLESEQLANVLATPPIVRSPSNPFELLPVALGGGATAPAAPQSTTGTILDPSWLTGRSRSGTKVGRGQTPKYKRPKFGRSAAR